jgi:hypothetical protein
LGMHSYTFGTPRGVKANSKIDQNLLALSASAMIGLAVCK